MDSKYTINLREKFINWCEKTTFHAIPNIATNKHYFLKLMWMLCLLASVSYCCTVLTSSIMDYYNYRVLTTYDMVQESSATFPVVVVCRTTKSPIINFNESSSQDDEDFLNQMVMSCFFKNMPCDRENDLEVVMTERYGKCVAFNRGRLEVRRSSKYGPKSGLRLELLIDVTNQTKSEYDGFVAFITNQTDLVRRHAGQYQALTDNQIFFSTGTHTYLPINRLLIIKLPYPYSDCFKMSDEKLESSSSSNGSYIDMVVKRLGNYVRSHCLDLCWSQQKITECKENNTLDCNEEEESTRSNEFCGRQCPRECEKVSFRVGSISSADYPSSFYKEILIQNTELEKLINDQEIDSSSELDISALVASISVFYDSDTYEKITETPEINFTTLLANLGGQFGLFLGISLLSFLELFELLIWIALYVLQKMTIYFNLDLK